MRTTILAVMAAAVPLASAAYGQSCGGWTTTILNPPNVNGCAVTCVGSTFQGGTADGAPVAWAGSSDSIIRFSAPQSIEGVVFATFENSLGGRDRFGRPCVWRGPAFEYESLDSRQGAVFGMSGGVQVGDLYQSPLPTRAAIWRDGLPEGVALPSINSNFNHFARAISGTSVAGYYLNQSNRSRALAWTVASGNVAVVELQPEFAESSSATATDGIRQGGYAYLGCCFRAVVWSGSASSMVILGPPDTSSEVTGMSAGVQVGYVIREGQARAFLWRGTPESGEDITPPWAINASIRGVWSDGSRLEVVGSCGSWYGQTYQVLWTYEPPQTCCPADLNQDGVVDADDLGRLLANWGFVTPNTVGDLNGDWAVNGADVGQLLAAWGPCTN